MSKNKKYEEQVIYLDDLKDVSQKNIDEMSRYIKKKEGNQ